MFLNNDISSMERYRVAQPDMYEREQLVLRFWQSGNDIAEVVFDICDDVDASSKRARFMRTIKNLKLDGEIEAVSRKGGKVYLVKKTVYAERYKGLEELAHGDQMD